MSLGPPCPSCSSRASRVIDTRVHGDAVRRRRVCATCQTRWTTSEEIILVATCPAPAPDDTKGVTKGVTRTKGVTKGVTKGARPRRRRDPDDRVPPATDMDEIYDVMEALRHGR